MARGAVPDRSDQNRMTLAVERLEAMLHDEPRSDARRQAERNAGTPTQPDGAQDAGAADAETDGKATAAAEGSITAASLARPVDRLTLRDFDLSQASGDVNPSLSQKLPRLFIKAKAPLPGPKPNATVLAQAKTTSGASWWQSVVARPSDKRVGPALAKSRSTVVAHLILAALHHTLLVAVALFTILLVDGTLVAQSELGLTAALTLALACIAGIITFCRHRITSRMSADLTRELQEAGARAAASGTVTDFDASYVSSAIRHIGSLRTSAAVMAMTDVMALPIFVVVALSLDVAGGLTLTLALVSAATTAILRGSARQSDVHDGDDATTNERVPPLDMRNSLWLSEPMLAERWKARLNSQTSEAGNRFDRRRTDQLAVMLALLVGGLTGMATTSAFAPWPAIATTAGLAVLLALAWPLLAKLSDAVSALRSSRNTAIALAWHFETAVNAAIETSEPNPNEAVRVDGLRLLAPNSRKPVLSDISFSLETGDRLVVMGPDAAGKSVLLKAIAGLWRGSAGSVRIAGKRPSQMPRDQLIQSVILAEARQHPRDASIADMIASGATERWQDDIEAAARVVGLHATIMALPKGYETPINPEHPLLSTGQMQRLTLANVICNTAPLVLIDALSMESSGADDDALMTALQTLRRHKRTVIVVSNQRSVAMSADRLLVLNAGHQLGFGRPSQLLKPHVSTASKARHAASEAPESLALTSEQAAIGDAA